MTEMAARLGRPIRRLSRPGALAAVLGLLVLVAGAALFARAYTLRAAVLPGVSVAGVDLGGLSRADAQARLRGELGARLAEPVRVNVDGRSFAVRPDRVWTLDVPATVERAYLARRESLASRLGGLVAPFAGEREVEPVLTLMPRERREVSASLAKRTRRPADAALRMKGSEVVVVPGELGTTVAVEGLLESVRAAALSGSGAVTATVAEVEPAITTAEAEAVAEQARTVVSAPVAIRFRGKRVGVLEPEQLAGLVRFPEAAGAYEVALARKPLRELVLPLLEGRLREPTDATFRVAGQRVRVVPSKPGTTLDAAVAQERVLAAALEPDARTARLALTERPAAFTTQEAKALGIRERVSTFTTDMGESSANRIWNVHLLGDYLDGTIIEPGETFSYNEEVGPRTAERGFREGQMIFGGVLIPSIGGGVCQTATTVFNAAFEAGLPIRTRYNHSFYISHYPVGRDATVSWGGPDLVFRNDLKSAILVKVSYTDATFTVSFYGTKQGRKVVSTTSTPTNYTQPRVQYAVDPSAPPGSVRTAAGGGPGFDVNVHRKVFERGKLLREDDFFTRYVPQNPTRIYGPGRTPPGPYFTLPTSA
ncbi:MAG TPA: VanW family protein [Gaiellaceae bacterium]|nr:VanW family protein [Gaiellaceae bacterium]